MRTICYTAGLVLACLLLGTGASVGAQCRYRSGLVEAGLIPHGTDVIQCGEAPDTWSCPRYKKLVPQHFNACDGELSEICDCEMKTGLAYPYMGSCGTPDEMCTYIRDPNSTVSYVYSVLKNCGENKCEGPPK